MDFRSSLYRGPRDAAPAAMVVGAAFAPDVPLAISHGPVAAYLSGRDDTWCATRRGVWWPAQGLWVDRLELTAQDVPPAGARTYPLLPPPGLELTEVHGQVLDDVAHVLVTGPDRHVITQASARFAGPRDLALLVLATLAAAYGQSEDPADTVRGCLSTVVLHDLGAAGWGAPGWSLGAEDLPGRVVKALKL